MRQYRRITSYYDLFNGGTATNRQIVWAPSKAHAMSITGRRAHFVKGDLDILECVGSKERLVHEYDGKGGWAMKEDTFLQAA